MFYSSEAAALRAFIRDKLGWQGSDVGDGWLISVQLYQPRYAK